MNSFITWIDHSEHDKRRALDAISLFKESGTVDELGIGTIRDAFADILFPGTSTIQTRARYFLFIPWIHLELERNKVPAREAAQWARKREIRLINVLAAADDTTGVIGIEARDNLKRLPSSVYWQGLETWGIRVFHGSQDQYFRTLDQFYSASSRHSLRVQETLEPAYRKPANWHPGLPGAPKDLWELASVRLRPEEADYLRERIMASVPGTLLAFLVDQARPVDSGIDFPWLHPDYGAFPRRNREQLDHARNFSLVMHGAALVYNLMLAQKVGTDKGESKWIEHYENWLEEWAGAMNAQREALRGWDRETFWRLAKQQNPRIPAGTQNFVNAWLDIALNNHRPKAISGDSHARALIEHREKALKGPRARLQNPRALELWQGEAGAYQLDFRWRVVQTILNDIRQGQER